MSNVENVANVKLENGKTIRQANNEKQHEVPLGTLVELNFGEYRGVRLYVAHHSRDCDGTPLYDLYWSSDLKALEEECRLDEKLFGNGHPMRDINYFRRTKTLTHFPRDSFEIISEV